MAALLLGATAVLPTTDAFDIPSIKQSLTFTQKKLSTLGKQQTLCAFKTCEPDSISIPKEYALANQGSIGITSFNDETFNIQTVTTTMLLPHGLRSHQKAAKTTVMDLYNAHQEHGIGCIISLPCGYGKTVLALNIASELGMKCLILTHTSMLAEQWIQAINQYIPNAVIGQVKQNMFDVDGKTHVIASLHSVAKRDYEWSNAGIGMLISDETHRAAAIQLSQALSKVPSKYRLGLSATLNRPDGLTAFLYASIGRPIFNINRERNNELRVFGIHLKEGCMIDKHLWNGQINTMGMLTGLTDDRIDARRRQLLAATWLRYCVGKQRKIIVVSDRIQLLKDLELLIPDLNTGFMIGETKTAEREQAREADIIFGSYQIVGEGLDLANLDTLMFLTSRKGKNMITQAVGRILRTGGKPPVVIDFVDANKVFKNMYKARCVLYRQMGAEIIDYDEGKNRI